MSVCKPFKHLPTRCIYVSDNITFLRLELWLYNCHGSKETTNCPFENHRAAALAQGICLRLPCYGLGSKSQHNIYAFYVAQIDIIFAIEMWKNENIQKSLNCPMLKNRILFYSIVPKSE